MYKIVETDKEISWFELGNVDNKHTITPILTLADEYGGRCQIVVDDHCYKLMLKQKPEGKITTEWYKTTPYIFREALEALKTLDSKPLSI